MTLTDRIREWLGINEALRAGRHNRDLLLAMSERLGDTQQSVKIISTKIGILNQGVGRVIAKTDAHFARDPQSAEVKAESDAIGEEVLRRLGAEQAVREQYGYTPKED